MTPGNCWTSSQRSLVAQQEELEESAAGGGYCAGGLNLQ